MCRLITNWRHGTGVVERKLQLEEEGYEVTRKDGSGRIRRRAKIEVTGSDGAENASDQFITSFLFLGHRKTELPEKLRPR